MRLENISYNKFKFLPYSHLLKHNIIRNKVIPSKKVSIITPTNKLIYMENIFNNYRLQHYPNKELIIILNNNRLDINRWVKYSKNFKNVSILQLDETISLGDCLNYAIDKASGNYIAKFDDDDYYGPNYLADQVKCLLYNNQLIVGKSSYFVYFKESGNTSFFLRNFYCFVDFIPGSTLVIDRKVFKKIKFQSLNLAEDINFFEECKKNDLKLFAADPFNYLIIRYENKELHTWKIKDDDFMNLGKQITDVADSKEFVTL